MATTAGAKKGLWSTIRRIAASDRISGLIMLGFALTGLVLANLPATAHAFETVAETHLFIPYTNLDLPIGHWAQDGLLTIFFLTVGLELKQELTTGSLANPKAAAVPMLCAVGGMIAPPILFLAVTALFSQVGPGEPGTLILTTTGSSIPFSEMSHGWAVPTATDIAFSLAVLALFAKALPGSIRAFLMTLATVDDLLAIILIAVFFSSINAWYWLHRRMRRHLGIPRTTEKSAVDRGWHRRYPRLDHDVRGRRAPHTGRRAGWPADPLS